MEGGRKGQDIQQDGRDEAPDQGAGGRRLYDAHPGDGAGQDVRAGEEDEEQHEHDAGELVAEFAPHQSDGIGVVLDVRVLQSDLADDVAGIDGDQAEADRHDDAGDHAQGSESTGDAEGAQGYGFHDQADGQSLPSQLVVFHLALGDGGAAGGGLFIQHGLLQLVLLVTFLHVGLPCMTIGVGRIFGVILGGNRHLERLRRRVTISKRWLEDCGEPTKR